ncbi:MAG: nucleotidyltransferase family protein, partial [Burkholderiales bacterium]
MPDVVLGAGQEEALALSDACVVHGVHGVLYHQLVGARDRWCVLPWVLREHLEYQAKVDQMWELAHKAELRAAVSALSTAGVTVLVMKGTALAYSLYPVPSIRSRGDTDLLVR